MDPQPPNVRVSPEPRPILRPTQTGGNTDEVSGAGLGRTRVVSRTPGACTHGEGHDLALNVRDALQIEACHHCPCCSARLCISVPPVGAILDAVAHNGFSSAPDLDVQLADRERQLLTCCTLRPGRFGTTSSQRWCGPTLTEVTTSGQRCTVSAPSSAARNGSSPIQPPRQGLRLVRQQSDVVAA